MTIAKLEIKIEVYEDDVLVVKSSSPTFEMAEVELGSMERFYLKEKARAEENRTEEERQEQLEMEEEERLNKI